MKKPLANKTLDKLLFGIVVLFVGFQIVMLLLGTNVSDLGKGNIFSQSGTGSTPFLKMSPDTEGYNKLLEYDMTIQLGDAEKNKFAGFNVRLPCCGFAITSEDEKNDCRCGHHVAFAGLIKYMINNAYSHEQIQQEIDAWKPVFYPECASNKNLCDLK